jgi:hypothetical protein
MRMAANESQQRWRRGGMTFREARWSVGNRAMSHDERGAGQEKTARSDARTSGTRSFDTADMKKCSTRRIMRRTIYPPNYLPTCTIIITDYQDWDTNIANQQKHHYLSQLFASRDKHIVLASSSLTGLVAS